MLDLGHVLFGGGLLGERPGQHEFCFKHRFSPIDDPDERRGHPGNGRVRDVTLDVSNASAGIRSYQERLSSSVAAPSCTMRLLDRSSGSASPRFSLQRRTKAVSSLPIMIRASEPPMKKRRLSLEDLVHTRGFISFFTIENGVS